jgi:dienelactone hydrolase
MVVPEQIYLRLMIVLATALALTACSSGGSKAKKPSSLEAPYAYDQSQPLDLSTKKTLRQGGVELRDVSFKGPHGEGVPAYLAVPTGKGPHPAVIYAHGSSGDRRDLLLYGILLAQKGGVAMALEMNYSAARTTTQPPKGIRGAEAVARNQIEAVVEVRRAVDVLRSLDFVDKDRIGYVGWSAGARTGAILAGVDHRIRAFDLLAGGALPIGASLVGAPANVRPRLTVVLRKTDPLRYVAHAAPSALLFQDGRKDELVPQNALTGLAQAGSKPKELRWYDSGHVPNAAAWDYSFTWLSKQLGLTNTA